MFATLNRFRRRIAVLTVLAMLASVLVAVPAVAADPEADYDGYFLMRVWVMPPAMRVSLMLPMVIPTLVTSTVSPITRSPRAPAMVIIRR